MMNKCGGPGIVIAVVLIFWERRPNLACGYRIGSVELVINKFDQLCDRCIRVVQDHHLTINSCLTADGLLAIDLDLTQLVVDRFSAGAPKLIANRIYALDTKLTVEPNPTARLVKTSPRTPTLPQTIGERFISALQDDKRCGNADITSRWVALLHLRSY